MDDIDQILADFEKQQKVRYWRLAMAFVGYGILKLIGTDGRVIVADLIVILILGMMFSCFKSIFKWMKGE